MNEMEFTDRYQALGIPYPDPRTMCDGHCEGTGVYPTQRPHPLRSANVLRGQTAEEIRRWDECHTKGHTYGFYLRELFRHREWWYWRSILRDLFRGKLLECDGWHFIKCPDCEGTGKRPNLSGETKQ